MNSYEIFGRVVVSGLTTIIMVVTWVAVWLAMMGDIWKIGPFAK